MNEEITNDSLTTMEKEIELSKEGQDDKSEDKFQIVLSGFWRRFFAFLLDNLILAVFGGILGIFLGSQFTQMGDWARLIGFAVVIVYFGVLNSSLFNGQTVGKRLLRIQVVNTNVECISLRVSLLRAFILFVPNYLGVFALLFPPSMEILQVIFEMIIFLIGFAIVYLAIFNRKTRQSFHDVILKTYVIKTKKGNEKKLDFGNVPQKHYIVIAIFIVVIIVVQTVSKNMLEEISGINFNKLYAVQQKICQEVNVNAASVTEGVEIINGNKYTYFRIQFYMDEDNNNFDSVALKAVKTAMDNYSNAKNKDEVQVIINGGYDIGIVKINKVYSISRSPSEWQRMEEE